MFLIRKKKAFLSFVIVAILLCLHVMPVFAEPSLTVQLDQANERLGDIEAQIEQLNIEIEESHAALGEATSNQLGQIEAMTARIKWIYENGGVSLMENLFSSANMAEFINYIEFMRIVSEYDHEMLLELKAITDEIEQTSNELVTKQKELRMLQADTEAQIGDLEEQIADKTRLNYTPSEAEIYYFAQLLEAEAFTNYDYKLAVATVVLNRVLDPRFADTITGVINERNQFGPVVTGIIHNQIPSPEAMAAARDSIAGARHPAVLHALYFNMVSGPHRPGVNIGGNVFW